MQQLAAAAHPTLITKPSHSIVRSEAGSGPPSAAIRQIRAAASAPEFGSASASYTQARRPLRRRHREAARASGSPASARTSTTVATCTAGSQQVERGAIAVAVGGQHHGAAHRLHGISINQPLGRRRQHHRQIVVAEHGGLLERPARNHHAPPASWVEPAGVDQRHPVVRVVARRAGPDSSCTFGSAPIRSSSAWVAARVRASPPSW